MEKMTRQVNCKAEPAKPANKNLQQNCEPSKKTCYQQMIQNNSATGKRAFGFYLDSSVGVLLICLHV